MALSRASVNEALGTPTLKPRGTTGYSQEVIALNEFGFQERRRTNPRGKTKSRYTVEIISQPILHSFDDQLLGQGPAEAIAETIREKIRAITQQASPSTLLFRETARKALERGATWAVKRYKKGRLKGDFTPGKTDRLFNDSGRLAQGLIARENRADNSWVVNVPANRFDPSTFASQAQATAMVTRLQTLVPELGDPNALRRHPRVQKAVRDSIDDLIKVAKELNLSKRRELRAAIRGLFF